MKKERILIYTRDMKVLVTHVDLDGYGINILEELLKKELKFDKVYNLNYGFEGEEVSQEFIREDTDLVITDLSVPEDTFKAWLEKLHSIKIYDHHESTRFLKDYDFCSWDTERCGTKIFYEDYKENGLSISDMIKNKYGCSVSDKVEYLVNLIDTYDRWQDGSRLWEGATRLNKLCIGYGNSFVKKMVSKVKAIWEWSSEDTDIYKKEEEVENQIYEETEKQLLKRFDNSGRTFSVVYIENKSKVSMVSSRLLKNYPDIDYLAIGNPWNTKLSFRSRKDLDLTQLHGVNGHKLAAGGQLRNEDRVLVDMEGYCFKWVLKGERKSKDILIEKNLLN